MGGSTTVKIVFFGTPDYVIPVLDALHKEYKQKNGTSPIKAVVTQKPKPAGRKQMLSYSAVDDWAHKRNLPKFYSPEEYLSSGIEAEIGVLASYTKIIPERVIKSFGYGILNIHPSLLPKYRGASPVQEAIKEGDIQTGATIIKIDEELDHGPIVAQFKEDILPDDTSDSLRNRLFERSSQVLIELLPAYIAGKVNLKPQDHNKATFTKQLKKEDGYINLKKTKPEDVERFIRAMQPWPIAWTQVQITTNKKQETKRLKILKAHIEKNALVLDEVQMEGKTPVSWKQFKEGYTKAIFL